MKERCYFSKQNSGSYLGLCGGAYFGSSEVQFELGTTHEGKGERELKFFPGIAKGSVFYGFECNTARGAGGQSIFFISPLLFLSFSFFSFSQPFLAAAINYCNTSTHIYCDGGCEFAFFEGTVNGGQ